MVQEVFGVLQNSPNPLAHQIAREQIGAVASEPDGIQWVKQNEPQFVWADLMIEDGYGEMVAKAAKGICSSTAAVLSSRTTRRHAQELIEDGTFDEFIRKPASSEQIQAAVEKYVIPRLIADPTSRSAGLEEEEAAQVPAVVDVYAQPSVGAGALSVVPKQWRLGKMIALSEDSEEANAGLEEAAQKAAQGRLVLVAVSAVSRADLNLSLPPKAIVVVLDPKTMDRVNWRAAAAFLERPELVLGLFLVDLTTGSVLVMELPSPGSSEPLRQAA